jgi:hypothetical protein
VHGVTGLRLIGKASALVTPCGRSAQIRVMLPATWNLFEGIVDGKG